MAGAVPTLAVVVVNYGSHELLDANLAPLGAFRAVSTVIVVDNFTTDVERRSVTESAARQGWTLVTPGSNLGFGEGMNLGVRTAIEAGADTLLLLNPDATIGEASVEVLLRRVGEDPMVLTAPVVTRPDGSVWSAGVDVDLRTGQMRAWSRRPAGARVIPWLTGACLMLSTTLWQRVDGFAPGYFLYWEDVDLSVRVVEAGGTIAIDSDSVAVHSQGGTQDPGHARGRSATYYYYNTRNRLLFAARHLAPADRRRWALTSVPAAWEILVRGGRRQLLRPVAPIRAVVTGTIAGLALMRTETRALRSKPAPR